MGSDCILSLLIFLLYNSILIFLSDLHELASNEDKDKMSDVFDFWVAYNVENVFSSVFSSPNKFP